MAEVRIINQTEASSVTGEEFLLIDDSTAGTKKVSINTVLSDLKEDLPYITVNGTALVINTGVVDGNEVEF